MRVQPGKVYFVGAGPGDPKLITIRGKEALEKADVIFYDRLADPRLLHYAKKNVEFIYCGKLPDRHTIPQDDINQLLVDYAKQGKTVVRLKGGDPSIFGRVGEEAEACANQGIAFEMVPGITSGIAAPLYAGIPLTHRDMNSSFAVITGHKRVDGKATDIKWEHLAKSVETLVFYMGVNNLSFIRSQLLLHGRSQDTPVALVRWGTLSRQQTLVGNLGNIVEKVKEARFQSPAIIVVGEVVRLREKLAWIEQKPLFGKRYLIPFDACEWRGQLEELGAEVYSFPAPILSPVRIEREIAAEIEGYDWVVFPHSDAVSAFFGHLKEHSVDVRRCQADMIAIGKNSVQALEDRGIIGQDSSALSRIKAGEKVLFVQPDNGSAKEISALKQRGAHLTEVSLYQKEINGEHAALISDESFDGVVLSSSMDVAIYHQMVRRASYVIGVGNGVKKEAKALNLVIDVYTEEDHVVQKLRKLTASEQMLFA